MTGKELIELIRKNNAEDLQIMLFDSDGGFALWHYLAEGLSVEKVKKDGRNYIPCDNGEKVAIVR